MKDTKRHLCHAPSPNSLIVKHSWETCSFLLSISSWLVILYGHKIEKMPATSHVGKTKGYLFNKHLYSTYSVPGPFCFTDINSSNPPHSPLRQVLSSWLCRRGAEAQKLLDVASKYLTEPGFKSRYAGLSPYSLACPMLSLWDNLAPQALPIVLYGGFQEWLLAPPHHP